MFEPLYPYQQNVIPRIVAGLPIYLGFDPGLGKSRTALEAARERGADNILIISPASGRYVWERECRKWWPEIPFRIVRGAGDLPMLRLPGITLVTYGLLSQRESPYAAVVAKRPAPYHMTILDEAAAVKTLNANRSKAILQKMWPKLGYVLPMSGTPAPNHAGELFSILKAHYPNALLDSTGKPMNQFQFEDAFCRVVQKRFGGGRDVRVIEGSRNLDVLRNRLDGYMQRVKKEDVLKDLPAIRWDVVPVSPKADLSMLPSAPQGLSDDALLGWLSGMGDEHVMRVRRMLGIAKLDSAVDYIDDFLTNLALDRKVLVFAHHKEVIAALHAGLAAYRPAVITGETVPYNRTFAIDRFLGDSQCRVFIGNIQAAGTALTLFGPNCKCSDVIFVEASYSVGDNVQAASRVHRIGQKDGVVARLLTAHGTLDDRIQDILARKATDFDQLFN